MVLLLEVGYSRGAHPLVVTVEQVNGMIFDARRKGKHGRVVRRGARIPG